MEPATTLVADIEADGLLDTITRIWCLTIGSPKTGELETFANQPGYTPLSTGFAILKRTPRVSFHNGLGYDLWAINRFYPTTLKWEQIWDTMVVARLLDPKERKHSLGAWGERLGIIKPEHDEWDRFSEAMVSRNREDVKIGMALFRKLWGPAKDCPDAIDLEHHVQWIIAKQTLNGFTLDVPKARELEASLRQEYVDVERGLKELHKPLWKSGDVKIPKRSLSYKDPKRADRTKDASFTEVHLEEFNPGSRSQIEFRLKREYGWTPNKFTPSGRAKIDDTILNDLAVLYPEAKSMARYFRVSKELGQLADGDNAWLKLVKPDNRVYGSVNTLGAITGRMSHFAPNMAQVDKKDLRMREVWIPGEGLVLVGSDAEGLELRMLGHYLEPHDGGAFIKSVTVGNKADGTDPHTINQNLVGLYSRDSAKTAIYAYLYGCGNAKLGLIIIQDAHEAGKPRPKGTPAYLGKIARKKLETGIVGLKHLVIQVKKMHKSRGWVRGLDGRRIYTRSAHSALNTLLQGAGAVVMKKALITFDAAMRRKTNRYWAYCVNVHDEVQCECDPDIAELLGRTFAESITAAGLELKVRCPLSGTYDIGKNWKETH